MLLGAGAILAGPDVAIDPDPLDLFFRDDVTGDAGARDIVIIRRPTGDTVWHTAQFGARARFVLVRTSSPRSTPPMATPTVRHGATRDWWPSRWVLTVQDASFPGGPPHVLTFTFERTAPQTDVAFGPWELTLSARGWAAPGVAPPAFTPIRVDNFLYSDAFVTGPLSHPAMQATLDACFGQRVEAGGPGQFGLDAQLRWRVLSEAGLYILNVATAENRSPFGFQGLTMERVFGDDGNFDTGTPPLGDRLFADWAPQKAAIAPVGLYGALFGRALPTEHPPYRFELGTAPGLRAVLTLHDTAGLRAAVRHWGNPRDTVAGIVLPSVEEDCQSRAKLLLLDDGPAGRQPCFELAGYALIRHRGPDGSERVVALLTPSAKEHRVQTPFGPVEVRAAPAVPPRPGMAARVPPIRITTRDRTGRDERLLVAFEAVLSLSAAHVHLPAQSYGEAAEAGHVTRLDFASSEIRFTLPAVAVGPEAVASDALVPLGPGPGPDALLDLGRATLMVLRPADLLSLSFRFSGLLLLLPRRGDARAARVLPSRGGPVCRRASATPSVPDLRPIMVVEFPPQHVAERAYFRRVETPVLPELDGLAVAGQEVRYADLLAKLRQPKPARGADTGERDTRIENRGALKALGLKFKPANSTAPGEYERRAAIDTSSGPRLPREQQVYLGPEFLDADGRRLMLEVLRVAPIPPKSTAAFALSEPDLAAVLVPFGLVPPQPPPEDKTAVPFDALNPRQQDAVQAVERAKERASSDYAEFRANFATIASVYGAALTYKGAEWFERCKGLVPPALSDWVAAYDTSPDRTEPFEAVTEARLSGPSRLAFRINCDDFEAEHAGGGFAFSLEALTNWGSMELSVVRRAERLTLDLGPGPGAPAWTRVYTLDDGAILDHQGLTRGDHIAQALDRTRRGGPAVPGLPDFRLPASPVAPQQRLSEIAASARARPDPFQTAIELPFRLLLSPAQDATWRVPRPSVLHKAFGRVAGPDAHRELWSARLAGAGTQAGVRAVWSPDFRPDALLSGAAPGPPPHGPWAPWSLPPSSGQLDPPMGVPRFRTAIDAYERHELVILSSVHGLPVLGRRASNGALIDGSQFDPPDGYVLSGLQPDAPLPEAGQAPQPARDYSAIYRPQPLSIDELSLTALGGTLVHDTAFVPPAAARLKRNGNGRAINLFDALSIERWRNRTVLGRDISVELVAKGFLFPIGHKAALVKLTERRFEAGASGPVAVLIQREFLRVGQPQKQFPAYGQPNLARRWPARTVELLTRRTPDLVNHETKAGGQVFDDMTNKKGVIFWPRTAPWEGAEVRFEMRIDDEGASGAMPLIFVDNTAAHDTDTMAALVKTYVELPAARRRLPRNGQPVCMAPAAKTGDTTYATDWWDLLAEGRDKNPSAAVPDTAETYNFDNSDYGMDPFMEGLDQPGFYPLIQTARCRLTQVERLTGTPVVWSDVGYDGHYVAHGFVATAGDASVKDETFLRIESKTVSMSMAGTDRSGGIGQPDTYVVGLSRAIGPVGAANPAPAVQAAVTTPPVPKPGTVPSIAQHAAKLDSKSLFPVNARLLGLVQLSDVVKIAAGVASQQPTLKEATEYGAAGAQASASEARAFVTDSVLRPIQGAIVMLDQQWATLKLRNTAIGDLSPDTAYPQIGQSLTGLRQALAGCLDVSPALPDPGFFAALAAVYEAGRTLIGAIEEVLRDPLASLSAAQGAKLQQLIQAVRDVAALLADPRVVLREVAKSASNLLTSAVLKDQPWRRLLFVLPPASGLHPEAFDQAVQAALDKALTNAVHNGSLKTLRDDFAEALKQNAQGQLGDLLNAAIVDDDLATPRLRKIWSAIERVLLEFNTLLYDLNPPAPDTLATALDRLGRIVEAAGDVIDQPIVLPGLADACQSLHVLPTVVAQLAALLVPLDEPPASAGLPGPDAPIRLDEAIAPARALIKQLDGITGLSSTQQTHLRQASEAVAAATAKLEAALKQLLADVAAMQDWSTVSLTGCVVPDRLVSTLVALAVHRDAALDALRDLLAAVAAAAAALQQAATAIADTALLRASAMALQHVMVGGLRLFRAATLLGALSAGKPAEGNLPGRTAELTVIRDGLRTIAKQLPTAARADMDAVASQLEQVGNTLAGLEQSTRQQAYALRGIDMTTPAVALETLDTQAKAMLTIADRIKADVRDGLEQVLVGLVLRLGPSVAKAERTAGTQALAAAEPLLETLAWTYRAVTVGRDKLRDSFASDTSASPGLLATWLRLVQSRLGASLFTVPCNLPGTACTERLAYENSLAAAAADTNSPADARIAALRSLAAVWRTTGPAIFALTKQFAAINAEFVRTILLSAIDLRPLRREIEQRIRDLIPSRVTLDYALDNALGRFPDGPDAIFQPGPDTRLQLRARTVINLLPDPEGRFASPQASVTGEIGPFAIALLGTTFDVVTLNFDGLRFAAGTGRSPDFKVRFHDVKMGEKARFLEELQSYLSPKGGGFFLRFLGGDEPGIEAGYGINLGVIGIGTLSFSNVILNAAVRLPFGSDARALFVISIGRSDAPFLISSTIFGGGGYLALIADSKTFVGFEASFDYGGVAAFGFGPLQGVGQLTMGITLRKMAEQTAMGATFFAGGAAHIACFSMATALAVRLVQDPGGPMYGSASYTFAFSIGITDLEFVVDVVKNEGRTMGGGTKSGALSAPGTMLAARATGTTTDVGPGLLPAAPATDGAHVDAAMPTQDEDWRAYRGYFDVALRPASRWAPL